MLCSHTVFSLRVMFWFYVILLWLGACEGKTELPKNLNIKAVLVFGDSIVDQGNNNNITTLIKCNFPPYGKDFIDGKPTGRFTNAKTPADLIGIILSSGLFMHLLFFFYFRLPTPKICVFFITYGRNYKPNTREKKIQLTQS